MATSTPTHPGLLPLYPLSALPGLSTRDLLIHLAAVADQLREPSNPGPHPRQVALSEYEHLLMWELRRRLPEEHGSPTAARVGQRCPDRDPGTDTDHRGVAAVS